jgi:hypothetical protein
MDDRSRAHVRPDAQRVREWAVEQVLKTEAGVGEVDVVKAADTLATYVLTGEVPA